MTDGKKGRPERTIACPQVRCHRRFPERLIRTTMATLPRQAGNRPESLSVTLCPLCMTHFEAHGVQFNEPFSAEERREAEAWREKESIRQRQQHDNFVRNVFSQSSRPADQPPGEE